MALNEFFSKWEGKIMDKITLKRGGKDITFNKLSDCFAVRLKHGKATDEKALEASLGRLETEVKHMNSAVLDKMEIFGVKKTAELEKTMDELRKAPAGDIVTHIYNIDNTPGGRVIPTGTITIQFEPDVENHTREEILKEFGLEIIEDLDFLPHGYTVKLTKASKENPLKTAATLQKCKEIKIAEPDLNFKIAYLYTPADTLYPRQWHLNNIGDPILGLKEGADVKAKEAWNINRGSQEITVCVMDDAFDLEHPDFNVPGKIVTPKDFGQDDLDPSPTMHYENHGTACAGLAIAQENGTGVVGLAPGCSFMPVRLANELSDDFLVELFQYAIDNKADVISCSWHADIRNFPLSAKISAIIHKAATQGRENNKGCVILFAAGNYALPLDGVKDGEICYQGFALHPDVIAVGASNSLDQYSTYSNYGPELTICAPSSGSPGRKVVTTDRRGFQGYGMSDFTYSFGGTSASTPIAAGLAALILSVDPDLSASQVRQIIIDTADKIDEENGGYVNGHSPLYGYGRINAHKALILAGNFNHGKTCSIENIVNKKIPDMKEVEDIIIFPYEGTIEKIDVSVDIRHTYRGDLRVVLISPMGDEITLVDRMVPGWRDDIIRSFRSIDEPGLFKSVVNRSAKGEWRLKVIDEGRFTVGELKKWGLIITYKN
jgi:subtilisin-like proprotein convertase family protein